MADTGTKSINSFKQAVKEAESQLLNYEKGTDSAAAAQDRLREATNRLRDAQTEIKASTQTTTELVSNTATSIAGFAGGIQAATGAMELFGIESEGAGQALVKFQALQSIVSGFTALSSGVKAANLAFKGFNATLLANPILAIVAAVAALIAGLVVLGNFLASSRSGVDDLNATYEEQKKQIEETNKNRNKEIDIMKAQGASQKELIEFKREAIRDDIRLTAIELENRQKEIKALENKNKAWFSGERKRLKALKAINDEQTEYYDSLLSSLEELDHQYTIETVKEDKARDDARKEAAKRAAADILKAEQEVAAALKSVYADEEAARIQALNPEEIEREVEAHKELVEGLIATLKDENATLEEQTEAARALSAEQTNLNNLLTAQSAILDNVAEKERIEAELRAELDTITASLVLQEQEISEARYQRGLDEDQLLERQLELAEQEKERYDAEVLRLEEALSREQEDTEERLRLLQELETARANAFAQEQTIQDKRDTIAANDLKRQKEDADKKKKIEQATLKSTAGFLSAASDLLGENTVAGKALAVSGAVINTYLAASSALAMDAPGPARYIAFATALITGFGAVKNILQTDVPGASDSTSASVEAPSYPSMPELSSPIQETHNNLGAFEEDFFNQTSRVILVESDVTGIQNRVKTAESEASF